MGYSEIKKEGHNKGSEYTKTGVVVNNVFNLLNATYSFCPQTNAQSFFMRLVSSLIMLANPGMNCL